MPDPAQYDFHVVARIGEIPLGEGRQFEIGDKVVAVFNVDGEFRAIDDMCPHMGASLSAGHLENGIVACPWHAWRFDTRDGTWCDNRRVKIGAYPVRVDGEEISVGIPRVD